VIEPLARIVASSELRVSRPRRRLGDLLRYAALLVRVRAQAKGIRSVGGAVRSAAR
jgi:hypothetical protein